MERLSTYSESLLRPNNVNDAWRHDEMLFGLDIFALPWRRSLIPKYVRPNSLTFSSKAAHWASESGSDINDWTVVKFLRDTVLRREHQLVKQSQGDGGFVRDIVIDCGQRTVWSSDCSTCVSAIRTSISETSMRSGIDTHRPSNA